MQDSRLSSFFAYLVPPHLGTQAFINTELPNFEEQLSWEDAEPLIGSFVQCIHLTNIYHTPTVC